VPHTELTETVLDESGYTAMWQADKTPEAPGRLENLKELVTAMEEFENLGGFLEHVSLVMETTANASGDMVSLMTLHGAKGLEFDVVFLPGWEEGVFPHQRALDESGTAGLEEERRLAYVGLTRARKRAYVSYAASRRIHGMWQQALPSRFVAELPADHIETASAMGAAGGFGAARGGAGLADWGSGSFRAPRPARREAPIIDGEAQEIGRERKGAHAAGARVFHQKFGYGRVLVAEGDKLEIAFDKAGTKKVMASFVVSADQAG
jgi:DNA helicase-2/ATP-dependent DNA helicase PcrA